LRLIHNDLKGGSTVEESVRIFLNILDGNGTAAQKAVVIVNSGLAIKKMFPSKSLPECFAMAEDSLQGGMAKTVLRKLMDL